ncbi:hypothetical protein HaLaN_16595, partial [Haematococcus lacustris]
MGEVGQVARARATFSVLESSQGTNKSEKEEGWDLALALVPSLARD